MSRSKSDRSEYMSDYYETVVKPKRAAARAKKKAQATQNQPSLKLVGSADSTSKAVNTEKVGRPTAPKKKQTVNKSKSVNSSVEVDTKVSVNTSSDVVNKIDELLTYHPIVNKFETVNTPLQIDKEPEESTLPVINVDTTNVSQSINDSIEYEGETMTNELTQRLRELEEQVRHLRIVNISKDSTFYGPELQKCYVNNPVLPPKAKFGPERQQFYVNTSPKVDTSKEQFVNTFDRLKTVNSVWIWLRFNAIIAVLWLSVVPVTAMFFASCLEYLSMPSLISLIPTIAGFSSLEVFSFGLAVSIDSLILSLVAKKEGGARALAFLLISLSAVAAYNVSSNSQITAESNKYKEKLGRLENEVSGAQEKADDRYAIYLSEKWPGKSDPNACETGKVTCGSHYGSRAADELVDYNKANQKLISKNKELESFKSTKPNSTTVNSDSTSHVLFYIAMWVLIFISVCMREGGRFWARREYS